MQQVTWEKNQVAGCWERRVPFVGVKRACRHVCMRVAKNKLRAAQRAAKTGASGSVTRAQIKDTRCEAVRVVVKRLASIVLEHIHPNLLDKPTQRLAKKQLAKGLQVRAYLPDHCIQSGVFARSEDACVRQLWRSLVGHRGCQRQSCCQGDQTTEFPEHWLQRLAKLRHHPDQYLKNLQLSHEKYLKNLQLAHEDSLLKYQQNFSYKLAEFQNSLDINREIRALEKKIEGEKKKRVRS